MTFKRLILIPITILATLIMLTGCFGSLKKTEYVYVDNYVAVGIPKTHTEVEQIPEPGITREQYVARTASQKEVFWVERTNALITVIHLLNGKLETIRKLADDQVKAVEEKNAAKQKEIDNGKK